MQRPAPYETTYRHDRRGHRHRCRCCNRIIDAGETVLMAKVGRYGKTWGIHLACADKPHPCGTWRDAFQAWSDEYARRLGYRVKAA